MPCLAETHAWPLSLADTRPHRHDRRVRAPGEAEPGIASPRDSDFEVGEHLPCVFDCERPPVVQPECRAEIHKVLPEGCHVVDVRPGELPAQMDRESIELSALADFPDPAKLIVYNIFGVVSRVVNLNSHIFTQSSWRNSGFIPDHSASFFKTRSDATFASCWFLSFSLSFFLSSAVMVCWRGHVSVRS